MTIKLSNVVKAILVFLAAMNLGLTKLIGPSAFPWANDMGILYLNLLLTGVAVVLTFVIWHDRFAFGAITGPILLFAAMFIVGFIRTMIGGESFNTVLGRCGNYILFFLAIPMYQMLTSEKWAIDRFIRLLVALTIASYLVRIGISVIERVSGTLLFENIALESAAENWRRNGAIRINPPSTGDIIVPLCMYMLYQSKRAMAKGGYALGILLALAYSAAIHSARSQLLFQILEVVSLATIATLANKTNQKRVLILPLLFAALFAFFVTDAGTEFLDSFSTENQETGASTTSRLLSLAYYSKMFMQNVWFGTGLLNSTDFMFIKTGVNGWMGAGSLWDIGVFQTIVQFGLISILLYLYILYYFARAGVKLYLRGTEKMYLLPIGIAIALLLTGINIDWFSSNYAFSTPISVALAGYALDTCHSADFCDDTDAESCANDG